MSKLMVSLTAINPKDEHRCTPPSNKTSNLYEKQQKRRIISFPVIKYEKDHLGNKNSRKLDFFCSFNRILCATPLRGLASALSARSSSIRAVRGKTFIQAHFPSWQNILYCKQ